MEEYLRPTEDIDCENPKIKETASDITRGIEGEMERGKAIFYFVRDEIKYDYYAPLLPLRASATLERRRGFCIQKAVLLVALARAAGIPARLGFAKIRNHLLPERILKLQKGIDILTPHGFAELYIKGVWVKATPAFDLETCRKWNFIPVEFDGRNDALLHSRSREGRRHIEYLHFYGSFADVPHEMIIDLVTRTYGRDYLEAWMRGFR